MATTTASNKAISANVAKPATDSTVQEQPLVAAPSRREFLYYIWGASILMLLGQATAILLWFIYPRFKEGEFGGVFTFEPANIPLVDSGPTSVPEGRFHVINSSSAGLKALYGVCTHLGCLPKWVPTNTRFECPCHGSKYQLAGTWIEGPAPRGLDQFVVTITYADGEVVQTESGFDGIQVDPDREIARIEINTGSKYLGQPH